VSPRLAFDFYMRRASSLPEQPASIVVNDITLRVVNPLGSANGTTARGNRPPKSSASRPLVVITARAGLSSFGNTSIAPRERIGIVARLFLGHASATNAAANASRDWLAEQ
jgi:hypothetical protein